eukprot:jgi/Picre1/31273/NNA_006627.t1
MEDDNSPDGVGSQRSGMKEHDSRVDVATVVDAVRPLQVRASQIQSQAVKDQESRVQRWEHSEKPVLRDHAMGLKETMQLLAKEEVVLKQRVSDLETSTVRNHPGTSTGFNVIRSRVDSCGKPLETESLKKERDRLLAALRKFDAEIASAKAEIATYGEWTKLVAMQDTKRVYHDEINLIEVELLGREHYERMERDRQRAEETGLAQLQRLQENMLQTRLKYNKAKHRYYFPEEKGFNITFGGGGIFGACKDICISEIHGNLKIVAEPGEFGSKGPITPARVIVTFQAATKPENGKMQPEKSPSRKPQNNDAGENQHAEQPVKSSMEESLHTSDTPIEANSQIDRQEDALPKRFGKNEEKVSNPPPRGFAKRFLNRLGRKKEKYQGRDPSRLEPLPEDSQVDLPKRSLARKLLSRRAGRSSKKHHSSVDLDRLTFGGNNLDSANSSVGMSSVCDDESLRDSVDFDSKSDIEPCDQGQDEALASAGSDIAEHPESPLTREVLEKAANMNISVAEGSLTENRKSPRPVSKSFRISSARTMSKGSWLLDSVGSESYGAFDDDGSVVEVDDPDIDGEDISEGERAIGGMQGVYCNGRLSGFELIGEKGSKVPNLTIGKADVSATVFVRFVFEYDKDYGWRPGQKPEDKPKFHVEKLRYSIEGNNVPMPPTLIKHILRVAIPGLIQRRLLALLPKELGEYVQTARRGFTFEADVGLVGPPLAVLDADIGFEITGPAKSAKEAKKQQAKFEAAKEARTLLGLNLPQAQILSELFDGKLAIMQPPRTASISNLISFKAKYDAHPKLFQQLCTVINAAYHMVANTFDAVVTAIHDFTQRTIEELVVKGPLSDSHATLESMKESIAEDLDVLHAWHVFALRELDHFKSKFKTAGGTVLLAADRNGVVAGIENSHYEGPLRLRLPVSLKPDQDGAISFDLPLPSPSGSLGVFMDNFKGLTVPCHLRPPVQAINWVQLSPDSAVNENMSSRIASAIGIIQEVLKELEHIIVKDNMYQDDEDPRKALTQPRTMVGDRLGRMIVNRLKVKVRLDERRIGEIMSGLDSKTLGSTEAFISTAGRIISHLGDVMNFGLVPSASTDLVLPSDAPTPPEKYLLHLESSDISRLRADVQSLGFQSAITPGGAVRLIHALMRAAGIAFLGKSSEELLELRHKMEGWYSLLTRDALNLSMCIDTEGEVMDGVFIASFRGTAEDGAVRATSPLIVTNELDLVPLGKAMRGDPPENTPEKS